MKTIIFLWFSGLLNEIILHNILGTSNAHFEVQYTVMYGVKIRWCHTKKHTGYCTIGP